jgi:hypothetical protein
MDFSKRGLSITFVLLALVCLSANAQNSGEIRGTVQDPSGALVPTVALKIKDISTGIEKATASDADGAFTFLNLQAGIYRLTATGAGFQTTIIDSLVVETARAMDLIVHMKVGAVTESVEVQATGVQLETSSNQIATTVSNTYIQELPFNGRDILNFALLMPGSQTANDRSGRNSTFNGLPNAALNITIDGVNNNSQRFKSGGTSFFEFAPSRLDAVEEITVSTSGSGAEASGEGAMQIRFTTKRGTDRYHFKIFEQFQNEDLNANDFFKNMRGQPISKSRTQNFGGNFGGKLAPFVPYLRNKLFFFANFEMSPVPGSTTLNTNTLTTDSQAGFFVYNGTDGQQHRVNLLTAAAGGGQNGTIDPTIAAMFGRINQTKSGASGFLPVPNQPYYQTMTWVQPTKTTTIWPTARLDYQINPQIAWHGTWNLRHQLIDGSAPPYPGSPYDWTNGYKITTYVATNTLDWTIRPNMLNTFTFGVQSNGEYFYQGADPHQWAPYGNKVLIMPSQSGTNTPVIATDIPTSGNITPFIRNNPVYELSDNVSWVKGKHRFSIGGKILHTSFWETSFGTAGVPNLALGIAAGDPVTSVLQSALPGISTTNGDLTNAQNLYAILTGRLSAISVTTNVDESSKQYAQFSPVTQRFAFTTGALYFQDSFRATPHLTLNFGLRWQFDGPIHNTNGIDTSPDASSFLGPSTGLFQPGVLNGNQNPAFVLTTNPYSGDYMNPAPNFGFAWNPAGRGGLLGKLLGDGKTVIRGSYRIAQYDEGLNVISNLLSGNPGTTQSGAVNPGAPGFPVGGLTLASTIPAISVNPPTFTNSLAQSLFTFNRSASYINPNLVSPYVQDFTIGVQREVAKGTLLSVNYIGNKSTHLWHQYNYQETNIFENGFLQQFIQAQNNLTINVANGKTGFANNGLAGQAAIPIFDAAFGALGSQAALPAGSGYTNSTFITNLQQGVAGTLANSLATTNTYLCRLVGSSFSPCSALGYNAPGKYPINLFRANPFVNNINYIDDNGNTNYNALQIELRKSLSHGLSLTANYTWGHTLGNISNVTSQSGQTEMHTLRNGRLDYGPTPFDIRQSFQTYWTYDLPFGKGRLINVGNPILERVVGAWSIGAIWKYTSGYVQQVSAGRNTVNVNTTGTTSGVVLAGGLTPGQLADKLNTISGTSFPNLIADRSIIGSNGQANPQFLLPPTTPGVFGQFLYLYGPNNLSMDMSLTKEVRITERSKFSFQVEALNFMNHAIFPMATTNPTSATFGQVTSTASNPNNGSFGRVVQLRAYVQW